MVSVANACREAAFPTRDTHILTGTQKRRPKHICCGNSDIRALVRVRLCYTVLLCVRLCSFVFVLCSFCVCARFVIVCARLCSFCVALCSFVCACVKACVCVLGDNSNNHNNNGFGCKCLPGGGVPNRRHPHTRRDTEKETQTNMLWEKTCTWHSLMRSKQ